MTGLARSVATALLVAVVPTVSAACFVPEPDPNAYLTPVSEAVDAGLQPYWLGPSITAGSETYSYIEGEYPEGISGFQLNGIELVYGSGSGMVVLDVRTIPTGEWPAAEAEVRERKRREVERQEISVAGLTAELVTHASGSRPISAYILIIETPEAAVVVSVPSGGSPTPGGPDRNPLIDYETFLSVVENLRPYPE
jgi:hypothetical protein